MSKGLEVWKLLREYLDKYTTLHLKEETHIESVEGYSLDIIEKELKAFEIIRNKQVDTWSLIPSANLKEYHYVISAERYTNLKLSQEEYDLLKEVLLW